MFHKIAATPILGVYQGSGKFSKCASKTADITKSEDVMVKKAINLIAPDVIKSLAKVYNLSDNINEYIFPVVRCLTAQVPNSNGDRFSHEELTRFSDKHRCLVYQTFRNDPLHVEHIANDPKAARGFLPDVYYIQEDKDDMHVIAIAAVDTTKDAPLADGILSGDIDSFSMGCICDSVKCSYCHKEAFSDRDLCDHLKWHKMSKINGKLVYEDCLGVEYQELSVVGEPADNTARTQAILQLAASRQTEHEEHRAFSAISSLASSEDQLEIARYVHANIGKIPDALVRLANKLF